MEQRSDEPKTSTMDCAGSWIIGVWPGFGVSHGGLASGAYTTGTDYRAAGSDGGRTARPRRETGAHRPAVARSAGVLHQRATARDHRSATPAWGRRRACDLE